MSVVTLMAWWIGHYPHHTNVITSVSSEQAEKRLDNLKDIIHSNPRYQLVFPWVKQDPRKPWTKSELNVYDDRISYANFRRKRNQAGTANTASIFAIGISGKGLVGNRISGLAVVDDPHDENAAYSPTIRERGIDWYYRTYINCLLPKAKSVVITTRWHSMDLAGDIIDTKADRYKIFDTPAAFVNDQGEYESNWPEQFPMSRLEDKEVEIGTPMYQALYLNNVKALSGAFFKPEWFHQRLPHKLPEFKKVVISVDPAATVSKRSNYTAICVVAIDDSLNMYFLNMIHKKLHPDKLGIALSEQFNEAISLYGRCDKIIIEKAGQQTVIVNRVIEDSTLPVEPVNYPGDKLVKSQTLQVVASQGKLFCDWSEDWAKLFRSQILAFDGRSNAIGDDAVDSLSQAANWLFNRGVLMRTKLRIISNPYML